jgi:hypothetical protein
MLRSHANESEDRYIYFKLDETGKEAKMVVEFDSMLNT